MGYVILVIAYYKHVSQNLITNYDVYIEINNKLNSLMRRTIEKQATKWNKEGLDDKLDISSAKYSDLSEYSNNNPSTYKLGHNIDYSQLLSPNLTSNIKSKQQSESKKNKQLQSCDIRLDSEQFIQYFQEDQSILSLDGIMPEHQFRQFAKELEIEPINRQTIAYKFYNKGTKSRQDYKNYNKYYVDYLQWKQKQQKETSKSPLKNSDPPKATQNFVNQHLLQKQLEMQNYRSQLQKQNQQRSYREMKDRLKVISDEYKKKMEDLVVKDVWGIGLEEKVKEKGRQLGFEKIQFPLLKIADDSNTQLKRKKEEQLKWKQINGKSFVEIIKRPPRTYIYGKQDISKEDIPFSYQKTYHQVQKPTNMKKSSQQLQATTSQPADTNIENKSQKWSLNISEITNMPHRQFLLFYNHYQSKLLALTSPQQMKQLRKYRREALERAEIIQKLRNRVSNGGQSLIKRLSPEKKEKLFKVLYQDQLDVELDNIS